MNKQFKQEKDMSLKELRKTMKERKEAKAQAYLDAPLERFERSNWVDNQTIISQERMMNIENYIEKLSIKQADSVNNNRLTRINNVSSYTMESSNVEQETVLIDHTYIKKSTDNVVLYTEALCRGSFDGDLIINVNGEDYITSIKHTNSYRDIDTKIYSNKFLVAIPTDTLNIKVKIKPKTNTYMTIGANKLRLIIKKEVI